jgi:transposase
LRRAVGHSVKGEDDGNCAPVVSLAPDLKTPTDNAVMSESARLANVMITLGARDLARLRGFYRGLGWPQIIDEDDFAAFELRGVVPALFPVAQLARDGNTEPAEIPTSPTDAMILAIKSLAARCLGLDAEAAELNRHIHTITAAAAPRLRAVDGVGPDTAATLLSAIGDNPDRICSDAAFARLCGVCPLD